jgi:hypothetical protein
VKHTKINLGDEPQTFDGSMVNLPTPRNGDYTLGMNSSIWHEEHGPTWTRTGSLNYTTMPDHCGASREVGYGPGD